MKDVKTMTTLDKRNIIIGKYLDKTWDKQRYEAFKQAYNKAIRNEEDVFLFERKAVLTRFAYFLLKSLQARFEH